MKGFSTLSFYSKIQKAEDSPDVLIIMRTNNEDKAPWVLLTPLKNTLKVAINNWSSNIIKKVDSCYQYTETVFNLSYIGKVASLQEAIERAKVDLDAIHEEKSIYLLISKTRLKEAHDESARQIPVRPKNLAFRIDKLLWSVLEIRNWWLKAIFSLYTVVYFYASASLVYLAELRCQMIMEQIVYLKNIENESFAKAIAERPYHSARILKSYSVARLQESKTKG